MKITQFYYPFLERGGPAVKVRALARGLASQGHSVTVMTSDWGITETHDRVPDLAQIPEGWRHATGGVEALYLTPFGTYRSLTWNPAIVGFCRQRLNSFDIVHIYGTYDLLGPVVARACRRMAIPYVLEPMGMYRPIVQNIAFKWLYRQLIGESVAAGAARLIATSEQEKQELIEDGIAADKIVIRRNGIEIPALPRRGGFRRTWKIAPDALVLLFLGRMVSKKSPELLLQAFNQWRLSSHVRDSILVFAGPSEDASYARKLQADVNRLGLNKQVLFTGPLYGEQKWSALVDADVFVLPSQHENFGNAVAEALACGTPVIVTDRCGIAPLVAPRAGIVIPFECKALVQALRKTSDPAVRERMKRGCSDVAQKLSWDDPLAETEALYSELVNSSTATPRLAGYTCRQHVAIAREWY